MPHFLLHDQIEYDGKGEDFVCSSIGVNKIYAIATIADGVSSSEFAKTGASLAATELKSLLENSDFDFSKQLFDYQSSFLSVVEKLNELNLNNNSFVDQLNSKTSFATTIITAVIGDDFAQFSFVGNGAIIEIRKEWFELDNENMFRFGISNYLNPHIKIRGSETPLYKVLKAGGGGNTIKPDIITIHSNQVKDSIYLLCTDGLYSLEESNIFFNSKSGDFFTQHNPKLVLFLNLLKQKNNVIFSNPEEFKLEFRKAIKEMDLLDDDLSYALFIP